MTSLVDSTVELHNSGSGNLQRCSCLKRTDLCNHENRRWQICFQVQEWQTQTYGDGRLGGHEGIAGVAEQKVAEKDEAGLQEVAEQVG